MKKLTTLIFSLTFGLCCFSQEYFFAKRESEDSDVISIIKNSKAFHSQKNASVVLISAILDRDIVISSIEYHDEQGVIIARVYFNEDTTYKERVLDGIKLNYDELNFMIGVYEVFEKPNLSPLLSAEVVYIRVGEDYCWVYSNFYGVTFNGLKNYPLFFSAYSTLMNIVAGNTQEQKGKRKKK